MNVGVTLHEFIWICNSLASFNFIFLFTSLQNGHNWNCCDKVLREAMSRLWSFLEFLFLQGKRLVFVTNNSTKSRKQYGKKFETLGLNVGEVSS
jgi:hypothetical protein